MHGLLEFRSDRESGFAQYHPYFEANGFANEARKLVDAINL